jgi:hypothetical protein
VNYNPYELVKLIINGTPIDGRPIQFDSEPVNQKTMMNAFGTFVKPSRVITVCPDCGQGLTIDLKLPDPPFPPVKYSCPRCRPKPAPLVDPFIDPLATGRVSVAELDPLLHNPDKPLPVSVGVVADRFKLPEPPERDLLDLLDDAAAPAPPADTKPTYKGKKKPKKAKDEPARDVPLPKAEGMAEERDILDDLLDE